MLPFGTTWMDLEGIILNEMSDRERQVLQMLYGLTFLGGVGEWWCAARHEKLSASREQTTTRCTGSMGSQPLDHQGILTVSLTCGILKIKAKT